MAQYTSYIDDHGVIHTYEEEASPGPAALPFVIYKTVRLLSWFPWLFTLVWIVSVIRGILRIKGKEKRRSGIYLLTVGIIGAIKTALVFYHLFGKL